MNEGVIPSVCEVQPGWPSIWFVNFVVFFMVFFFGGNAPWIILPLAVLVVLATILCCRKRINSVSCIVLAILLGIFASALGAFGRSYCLNDEGLMRLFEAL